MKTGLPKKVTMLSIFGLALSMLGILYLQHPKFGAAPSGERMKAILNSPNYAEGQFQNQLPTPVLTDDSSTLSVILSSFWQKNSRLKPEHSLPAVKTNLKTLDRHQDTIVWLGHSSYYLQISGKRVLVDPEFSTNAAPISGANLAFEGTSIYSAEDMPEIDYLLITHDHWDHLDYPSMVALRTKVQAVVCGLGVGAHLERWGYAASQIHEADWFSAISLEPGIKIHVLPARHYSGRLLEKNKSLWVGFAIEGGGRRIFFSGDSGYGPHFAAIRNKIGKVDLAVLDMGQYDKRWANIHMVPEEAAKAAVDLEAKALLPAHIGKFAIANHPWDEPFERIVAASRGKPYQLIMPLIGQPVSMDKAPPLNAWWHDKNRSSPNDAANQLATTKQEVGNMRVRITINDKELHATLVDSASARDFLSLLPLSVKVEDFAGREKVAYLPRKISTSSAPRGYEPAPGDIAYYAPWGNIALFYKGFSYSEGLVKLGQIDAEAELLAFKGGGDLKIEAVSSQPKQTPQPK